MDGLADYSRNSGYVGGDVTLTNETVTCNFDRGRMFTVDSMDDADSAGVAFGMLAGEFIRTKVVPELDAFRFATYAGVTGVSSASGTLSTGADITSALRTATNSMDEDEVPMEDRVLFITPTLHGMLEDMDMSKSREVLSRFSDIVLVPQTRFYTAIEQKDGVSDNETGGGYAKAAAGKDINFMVIHKGAVIQFPKHIAPKVVSPEQNPDADAWKFGYRHIGVADILAALKGCDRDTLADIVLRLLTVAPATLVSVVGELTGIDASRLRDDPELGAEGFVALIEAWIEVNGIENFTLAARRLWQKGRALAAKAGSRS